MSPRLLLPIVIVFVAACAGREHKQTLADVDISDSGSMQGKVFVKPKSDDEIREAYYTYIRNASKSDASRLTAINRLAQLELELSNKLLRDSQPDEIADSAIEDSVYTATLEKTATLLSTALKDFPDAKDNDLSLYQLARTYDQLGRPEQSNEALHQLVNNYPKSPHYAEAQFRIGENAFIHGDYISAEDAYTEVILTPTSDLFFEKALFKRGWARYKQQLYVEAVDDYLEALTYHNFADQDKLSQTESDLFREYFRAIGLAFSYLQGAESLHTYFADKSNFKYLYHTYTVVADIYQDQKRFTDAANTLIQFTRHHPTSAEVPNAELKIIQIWQAGGFTANLYAAIDKFYSTYNPDAPFWKNNDSEQFKPVISSLREYVVLVASYFHSRYQEKNKPEDFSKTQLWYERYLKHYSAYANQDNIYNLYAEFLVDAGESARAIQLFESAAYDGELILDKKAAYATLVLSDELYNKSQSTDDRQRWLSKHTEYALRFVQLYPTDSRSNEIALHAAEISFANKLYQQAAQLANLVKDDAPAALRFNANSLQARAYVAREQYADAEVVYMELLASPNILARQKRELNDGLALAIYRQAEQAKAVNQLTEAKRHFARVSDVAPASNIASSGLFDAIALAMGNESWNDAIVYIKRFQQLYPKHKRGQEVSRQLSVAYLKSNQDDKAARELERIARSDDSADVQMAALWQAAELYESKKDHEGAIRSYRDYAHKYPTPFPQNMEAMYKLTQLYHKTGNAENKHFWQRKIQAADSKATKRVKNDRTSFIASTAVLELARDKKTRFSQVKLVEPLASNLKRKKDLMQEAIKLYGQASSYGLANITTESAFSIGSIYQEFSQSLLQSERPANLNAEELEQYNILLEDQAFPFEEKAIEFYETNLARVRQGNYNEWIENSFNNLVALFPVRFGRQGKIGAYLGEDIE